MSNSIEVLSRERDLKMFKRDFDYHYWDYYYFKTLPHHFISYWTQFFNVKTVEEIFELPALYYKLHQNNI